MAILPAALLALPPAMPPGVTAAGMNETVADMNETATAAREDYPRGRALFSGAIDLHGRMYTHVADMPPNVVRCSNCHAVSDGPEVPRSLAPRLTRSLLVLPRSRRGGPPSRYSGEGFCRLLRKGVDPAFVMISVEMPRYTMDDVDCAAIWRYLTGSDREENGH